MSDTPAWKDPACIEQLERGLRTVERKDKLDIVALVAGVGEGRIRQALRDGMEVLTEQEFMQLWAAQ